MTRATAKALSWAITLAIAVAIAIVIEPFLPRVKHAPVEPAGTHLTVNGAPLSTALPEPAGAPISVTEGMPTAPIEGGFDSSDATSTKANLLWMDYYGGALKLRGSGSLPVEINHKDYVLEVGETAVELRER